MNRRRVRGAVRSTGVLALVRWCWHLWKRLTVKVKMRVMNQPTTQKEEMEKERQRMFFGLECARTVSEGSAVEKLEWFVSTRTVGSGLCRDLFREDGLSWMYLTLGLQ